MINLSKLAAWLSEPGVDGALADEMLQALAAQHELAYETVNTSFDKLRVAYVAYAAAVARAKSDSLALAAAVGAVTGDTLVMLAAPGALLRIEFARVNVEQLIDGSWEVVGSIDANAIHTEQVTEQAFRDWLHDMGQVEFNQRSPYHAMFRIDGTRIIEVVYTPPAA